MGVYASLSGVFRRFNFALSPSVAQKLRFLLLMANVYVCSCYARVIAILM